MKKIIKRIIIVFLILVIIGITALLISEKIDENNKKRHLEEVKNAFSELSKIKESTNLYQFLEEELIKVGTIYDDVAVSLEEIKGDFFKIKNLNYYLYYQDVESIKEKTSDELPKYLLFNEKIETTKPVTLYKNKEKIITLDKKITAPIIEKNEDYYTVVIDEQLYQISTEEISKTKKEKNDEQEELKKISILYFNETNNIEEKIKYLKEQNYFFITEKELEQFLKGNIRLPKNTTMLIFKDETDDVKKLVSSYSLQVTYEKDTTLKYITGDTQTESLEKIYRYKIDSNTKLSRFKDMLQGKKEIKTTSTISQKIAVLNYHFFYDKNTQVCSESICLDQVNFEEQLKYLKENGFKTLTMQEFNDWLDKKIELPKKSVLITVDDGAMGTDTILPSLLEKYDAKATLFLISGWWPMSKYKIGNLEIQSHGHDLHHDYFCNNGKCNKKGLVLSKEEIKADFQISKQTIGNPIAFCYPFYAYNNTLVSAVKEEFTLAFIGGNNKASRNVDKYKIPRYIIYKNTSLENFKKMVN